MSAINGSGIRLSAPLVMICSAGCWGSATVMSKAVLAAMPPVSLLVLQLFASICFLWLILWTLRLTDTLKFRFEWKDLRWAITGVLEPGLAYLLTLLGLRYVSASQAGLIVTTEPIMVMVLAGWILRERVTGRFFALSLLALAGVALTVEWSSNHSAQSSVASIRGALLVFLGTMAAALYVVLSKRSASNHNALYLAALQQTCGLAFVCLVWPFFLNAGEAALLTQLDIGTLAWAVVSGVIQYALAFWAYLVAVRRMPVTQATAFLNFIPVFTILGAWAFLNEHMTLQQWGGAGVILVAMGMLRKPVFYPPSRPLRI